jgi:serine/threonine protein kinase
MDSNNIIDDDITINKEDDKVINGIDEYRNKNGTLIRVNDYNLVCTIGKGQFGKVYLVENSNQKRYAMKVLKRQVPKKGKRNNGRGLVVNNDDDLIMNEVNIMKTLNHPHIVNLIAFINDNTASSSNVYLVIDYVDGGPVMIVKGLTDHGTPRFVCPVEGTVLGESRACSLAAQIFDAMSYLHHHGIAHRDIKMDNILLDLDGNVRVADFGVSHYFEGVCDETFDTPQTSFKAYCKDTAGTFSFWSPEILEDNDEGYDAFSADVWACGIVIWCFLFGELPYPALDADALFESISAGVPSYPSRKSPECEDILKNMLTRNPNDRISFDNLMKHIWIAQHEKPIDEIIEPIISIKTAFRRASIKKGLSKWENKSQRKVLERKESLKLMKEETIRHLQEEYINESEITTDNENTVSTQEVMIKVNQDNEKDNRKQAHNACCVIS